MLTNLDRMLIYKKQNRNKKDITPRQLRRMIKKLNHAEKRKLDAVLRSHLSQLERN